MQISMYDISVPVLTLALGNLKHIVGKGAAHCSEQGIDESVVINTRLYPDMLPFSKQIQIATDISKGCVSRLSGTDAPVFEDDEATFDALSGRCDTTLTFVNGFSADQINGTEEKECVLKLPSVELKFNGFDYVSKFVVPNVQFHIATAYGILRNNGVVLGKADFLGPIN